MGPDRLRPAAVAKPATQIRMPACGPRYTLFTGGILVRRPACVRLAVSGPGVAAVTVAVPVLVSGRCTAADGRAAGGWLSRKEPGRVTQE